LARCKESCQRSTPMEKSRRPMSLPGQKELSLSLSKYVYAEAKVTGWFSPLGLGPYLYSEPYLLNLGPTLQSPPPLLPIITLTTVYTVFQNKPASLVSVESDSNDSFTITIRMIMSHPWNRIFHFTLTATQPDIKCAVNISIFTKKKYRALS